MRNRALSVISLTFALLVFSRAYAVSSEVSSTADELSAGLELNDAAASMHGVNSTKDEPNQNGRNQDKCVGSDIHDILIADRARLQSRTTKINEREAALQKLETTLKVQLAGIESANAELDKKIATLRSDANEDLAHLVGMYQTMKPKQAATIFDSMDPAFAAGFLREMNSNTAGLIMANMNAKKSYSISVLIAQRNAKYR